jgi:molecular chaperone GrpE
VTGDEIMAKAKKDETPEEIILDEGAAPEAPETPPVSPTEELEAALKAEKDKYLRLAAEFDNYRKRSMKEREALYSDIQSDTIAKLLPVYDNLARALKMECTDGAFYKGVDMTMTQLKEILTKLGITEIPAVGEPFNPDFHNAVMHVEDPAFGESTVAEEFEKGFKIGDKVIRCAMVKVAN